MSLRQIVSMKQRRSSLCPCPHLTVIPAKIPERIKRWRALLVLETKRLKIWRAPDRAQPDKSPNSSGLLYRPPRGPRKKETPPRFSDQRHRETLRSGVSRNRNIAVLRYRDNSMV